MWKIWRNNVKNMKKYVDILDLALLNLYRPWDSEKFRAPLSYSLWDLEKFQILPLYGPWDMENSTSTLGSGTWKNSTPEPPPRLWDLEKISWASQKMKIMFHVFQYGGGMARNFSKPRSPYRGYYELTCCVLTACSCLGKSPPQTLALLRLTAVS